MPGCRHFVRDGVEGFVVPPENADFAQKMLTHATSVNIVRIPEMNHFLPWTRYAQVKSVILEHLQ